MMESGAKFLVIVHGVKFSCYQKSLCAYSKYFSALLGNNWIEKEEGKVELQDINPKIFELILNFIDNAQLTIDFDNVSELVEAASSLQVDDILNKCELFLLENIQVDNLCVIVTLAEYFGLEKSLQCSFRQCLYFFPKLVELQYINELSAEVMYKVLSSNHVNIKREVDLFRALSMWVNAQFDGRKHTFCSLFMLIRVDLLKDTELVEVFQHFHVSDCASCQQFITNSGKSSQARTVQQEVWMVGGKKLGEDSAKDVPLAGISRVDVENEMIVDVSNFSILRNINFSGYKACFMEDDACVYLSGGETKLGSSMWMQDLWCYNVFTRHWKIVSHLQQPRRHHSMASSNGSIYLAGGFSKFRMILKTVVSYCIKSGKWKQLPDLNQPVYSAALSSLGSRLFLVKDFVETFNEGDTCWTTLQFDLPYGHGLQQAESIGDKLYFFATYDQMLIEFDPDSLKIHKKKFPRLVDGKMCRQRSKIFIVGGNNYTYATCYDPDSKDEQETLVSKEAIYSCSLVSVPCYA